MLQLLIELVLSGLPERSRTARQVVLRVICLVLVLAAAVLGALYVGGAVWSVIVALALIALFFVLLGRLEPVVERKGRDTVVRSPESKGEAAVRAARERAERDLETRGSHPLGHPGSGGRWSRPEQ